MKSTLNGAIGLDTHHGDWLDQFTKRTNSIVKYNLESSLGHRRVMDERILHKKERKKRGGFSAVIVSPGA